MIDAYLYSYGCVLASTLWWYILVSREKSTTYAKALFFLSVPTYFILLVISDGSLISKVVWLARDLGVFLGVALIGHYLANRTAALSAAVAALLALFKVVYFPALPALDAQGELLFDIKQHGQLQRIRGALARYDVKINRAFPYLKYPAYSDLDDFYVVDIPRAKLRKLSRIIELLYETGAVDAVEHNELVQLTPVASSGLAGAAGDFNIPSKIINDPDAGKQWAMQPFDIVSLHQRFQEKRPAPQKNRKNRHFGYGRRRRASGFKSQLHLHRRQAR